MRILVVDIGGTHVKVLATGRTLKRTCDSGPRLTPRAMVTSVHKLVADWEYDAVSIGVPSCAGASSGRGRGYGTLYLGPMARRDEQLEKPCPP